MIEPENGKKLEADKPTESCGEHEPTLDGLERGPNDGKSDAKTKDPNLVRYGARTSDFRRQTDRAHIGHMGGIG